MTIAEKGFAVLLPEDQHWRESNTMKIPNTDLLLGLGASHVMGGRLWRLPPYSANTWHRHVESWELYVLLEGVGRIRIGDETVTIPRYGSVLAAPHLLRQVFNDTDDEALWLIVAAPQEGVSGPPPTAADYYPEDPRSLPRELEGKVWPPDRADGNRS